MNENEIFDNMRFLHKEMWGRLATINIQDFYDLGIVENNWNIYKKRRAVKKYIYDEVKKDYNFTLYSYFNSCFACDLLEHLEICGNIFESIGFQTIYCKYCPLDWFISMHPVICDCSSDTLFAEYIAMEDEQEAKKIAIKMRDLPWIFEKVKEGLLIKENGKLHQRKDC